VTRGLSGLALLLAAALPSPAQDSDALARFRRAFDGGAPASADDRVAAARDVAFVEGRAGPEAVCRALGETSARLLELAEAASKARADLDALSRELEDLGRKRPPDAAERVKRLRLAEVQHRLRSEDERRVEEALRAALLGFRDPKALEWLAGSGIRGAKEPGVRAAVAEALGRSGSADPALAKALRGALRDREPVVREAALAALARLRAKELETLQDLGRALDDPRWTVRLQAARRLAELAVPESVDLVLARMPREEGRARRGMADLLAAMTGQRFGVEPEGWVHWWRENRAAYATGEKSLTPPKGGGTPAAAEPAAPDRGASFYGITVESRRVLFVVDISGSMREAGVAEGSTKEEEAKKELLRCIRSLGPGSAFGVFAFCDTVQKWKPGILRVSDEARKEAAAWIDALSSANSTNTYAALEEGFRISVADPRNDMGEDYGLFPDTIFLLTDGAPTTPEGKHEDAKGVPEWQKVLDGVRSWNREGRVVVHAVGVGLQINAAFLRRLAEENGGTFVTVK
jgi:HEAT repeat protein